MTKQELKLFYEKLYFHEIDARDKIHARLQLPLTLLLAVLGGVVFLFQNFDYQSGVWSAVRVMFVFFFCFGIIGLVFGTMWFVQALYNHTYWFLPDAKKTADYYRAVEHTYREWEERDKLVSDAMDSYLTGYYIEYAAYNAQVNDRRSAYIHRCNGAIIGTAVLFIVAYLSFYFGELDKGKMKSATEVTVTKPVEVRIQGQGR